ncbi:helix-turn-helix domain-containing protein [candidate division KSB1 bacterium]|nr:helix-turn-helix domain-containing protein [candidate division KSB1 bacterium]
MHELLELVQISRNKYPVHHRHAMRAFEYELVNTILDSCGGNKSKTAEILGLSRRQLQRIFARWEGLQDQPTDSEVEAMVG